MLCVAEEESCNFEVQCLGQEERREYWASLALRYCAGLGARGQKKLLEFFGSALAAVNNVADWKKAKISSSCIKAFSKEKWRAEAKKEWDSAKRKNTRVLLWTSPLYPAQLRSLVDAPILLYFIGQIDLLSSPAVAIVGSRSATSASQSIAAALAQSLSACGITIVSGMAEGIDCKAHYAALNEIGKSIGVLGTGINQEYPVSNRRLFETMRHQGLLVSEFPPDTPPKPHNFPVRNRIISGLSLGVVVVEAALRSGSLVTARLAVEQNREVFAVPAPALTNLSLGCQNLVRDGAHPVFNVDDILRNLGDLPKQFTLSSPMQKKPDNSSKSDMIKTPIPNEISHGASGPISVELEEEDKEAIKQTAKIATEHTAGGPSEQVMACLRENGIMHVDKLASITGITAAELNSLLTFLELLGKIQRLDGARYEAL